MAHPGAPTSACALDALVAPRRDLEPGSLTPGAIDTEIGRRKTPNVGGRWQRLGSLLFAVSAVGFPTVHAKADPAPAGPAIVGGDVVDAATVPWTVALFNDAEPDPYLAQFCGGVLIDPEWILTAAHCARALAGVAQIQVGWGKTELSSYAATDRREIDQVVYHPEYDLALLRLEEPATGVTPIEMWRDPTGPPHLQRYWAYGWGTLSAPDPLTWPDELHGVELSDRAGTSAAGPCLRYGWDYEIAHHVCAGWGGAGGRSACFGDSGGPLVVYTPTPKLVGITSFGTENCGDPDWPGVFERVSSSVDWIRKVQRDYAEQGYWVLRDGSEIRSATPVPWAEVDTGGTQTCALGTDGSLWCLQSPNWTRVGTDSNWVTLDIGEEHSCAIKIDRSLWCWGNNDEGRVGDGTTQDRTTPVQIGTDFDWIDVDAGETTTCGIRAPGILWCWGDNAEGQLGIGNRQPSLVPIQVGIADNWRTIAAGAHACGTRVPGGLFCWGYNADGSLGDGTRTRRLRPRQISTDSDWGKIEIHGPRTCSLRSGALWCWTTSTYEDVGAIPALVDGSASWRSFELGRRNTADRICMLHPEGSLWCVDPTIDGGWTLTQEGTQQDWQSFAVGNHYIYGVRGIPNAVRLTIGWSATERARFDVVEYWLDMDDAGELQKFAVFVDAFVIAISPPGPPEPIVLPAESTEHAITSFWSTSELPVLEAVMAKHVLDNREAHRWGFQVLSFIAALNGV